MNAITQEPGTVEDKAADGAAVADADAGLESLGELLAADEPKAEKIEKPGGEDAESGGSQEKKTAPTKFNDLAGATDLDLDALYKLEIQLEGADPVSIETLKDSYKEAHDFDLKVIEFEEKRTTEVNELVRAQTELQEILSSLPASAVKPEVLEKLRAKAEQTNTEERQKTLEVIPEWNNAESRAADIGAMVEHLQGYGFPPNYLQQIGNHRQLRYIRDNMLREKRIKAALAKVRTAKPDKSGNASPQSKAASKSVTVKPVAGQSKLEAALLT